MYVVYEDFCGYHLTNIDNYNAHIRDARQIVNLEGFVSVEAIKSYLWLYGYNENNTIFKI